MRTLLVLATAVLTAASTALASPLTELKVQITASAWKTDCATSADVLGRTISRDIVLLIANHTEYSLNRVFAGPGCNPQRATLFVRYESPLRHVRVRATSGGYLLHSADAVRLFERYFNEEERAGGIRRCKPHEARYLATPLKSWLQVPQDCVGQDDASELFLFTEGGRGLRDFTVRDGKKSTPDEFRAIGLSAGLRRDLGL